MPISRLRKKGIRSRLPPLRDEMAELRAKLVQNGSREEELTALRDEVASLRAQLADASAELAPVDSEEMETLRKKAVLYDRMSSQLGNIMITANHNADQLLDETRQDAEQTLSAAKTAIAGSAALLSTQLEALLPAVQTPAQSAKSAGSCSKHSGR